MKTKFCDFKSKQSVDSETGKLLTDVKTMVSYKGTVYFVNIHTENSMKARRSDLIISIFCEQERIYTYKEGYNKALYEDKDEDFIKEILEHFNLMKYFKGNKC